MGHHPRPTGTTSHALPPLKQFGGLLLFCLLGLWLLASTPSAHAVNLPFSDTFKGKNLNSVWQIKNETPTYSNPSYHKTANHDLHIISYGVDPVDDYYAVYLDDISGDFTATIRLRSIDNNTSSTKSGLIVQNNLGSSVDTGHIQVGGTHGLGFFMLVDDDGDGTVDQTFVQSSTIRDKNRLRITRIGNTFSGFYSTDDGKSWNFLGTTTSAHAGNTRDVGLFGHSGGVEINDRSVNRYRWFKITGTTASYTYFRDADGDNFGDPADPTVTGSSTPPSGYVTDGTDCDDTNANTYPGATELCDGFDNNCDGDIDEGLANTTYYLDADGDGYGTGLDTYQGCSAKTGYVTAGGDCDDNNALINPGSADICENNIDEDCSGADATCYADTICYPISDTPLSVTVGSSPGIIMFVLDDSGSMAWSVMCPENSGRFNNNSYYTSTRAAWKSQYHGYNRIYYNPGAAYTPWPNSSANTFTDASFTSAPNHPIGFSGGTRNLTGSFTTINGTTISYGHYYIVSTTDSEPYLVDLGTSAVSYYKVTGYQAGDHGNVTALTATATPPADVAIPQANLAEARTNFANWFTYSSRRETATKLALGLSIEELTGVKMGIHTLNRSVSDAATLISDKTDAQAFLTKVYSVARSGGTPLRRALQEVGRYFDADDGNTGGIGASPFDISADGGDCQQAFAILMTDGYGNGSTPNVGNADNDNNTAWDGPEFAGANTNRLPDVAMYYYERDLSTSLANKSPLQDPDYEADHQRMVTYTVSFGITGFYDPIDYPNCPPAHPDNALDCPAWLSTGTLEALVDELWHTAVNGRGDYINTGTPQELSDAMNTVLNDITQRAGTAASIAISSEKLDTGLVIYQGFFNSEDWSGNLEAYDVDPDGVVDTTPKWSAKTQLDAVSWDTGRKILTRNDTTGATVAFRYSSLSPNQKLQITSDQLDYIRGDASNQEVNNGALRNRNHKLGDIAQSSPILHENVVYVGANDGMFHAFDADTGDEIFAYVPSFVYPNLGELSSPNYAHKYFADGTATAKDIGGTDWVVSGLRKGGRGFFGINVTSPKTLSEGAPPTIWEYPTAAVPDDDVGYTFGEVTFAQTNVASAGELIFAANGYDSPNGHAVLFILNLDGTLYKKIDTGVGGTAAGTCNGLSDPLVVDVNDDGKADVVYAGDLLGNLWKFNISGTDKSSWDVAYKTGSTSKPLFTAQSSTGTVQPITSKPSAMFHCDITKKGTMVVFGTGRMLSEADLINSDTQTVYGIWDWQDDWAYYVSDDGSAYHMGAFNVYNGGTTPRSLSNITGNSLFPSNVTLTLLQQTQTTTDDDWRYTTSNEIDWFSPKIHESLGAGSSYTGGTHIGWYMDLPEPKERIITKTQIRDGKAYIISIIPEPTACTSGGTTVGTIIDACNGGQIGDSQWDTNNDGVVDHNDHNASGKKFGDDIYYAPAIIDDKLFFTKDRVEETKQETSGLFYWRVRE